MRSRFATTTAAVLLALSVAGPAARAVEPPSAPQVGTDGKVRIHFEDVDLPVFVNFISKITGRNFVFSEKIAGTVTIISPEPVTVEQAYAVFQSVLNTRGLTTIDDGVVARVVPLKEARNSGGPVIGRDPGATGYATRLIPLEYVGVEEAAAALQSLISRDGSLTPYTATNTLIVSDTITNLERIAAVVKAIDTPRHEQAVEVIPLQHADASTMAEQVTTILQEESVSRPAGGKEKGAPAETKSSRTGVRVVPDSRTNSLIVMGSALELKHVRELITGLDNPLRPGDARLHVYHARYADALQLAEVVGTMVGSRQQRITAAAPTRGGRDDASPRNIAAPTTGTAPGFESEVVISADPSTNSVLVNSSAQDYRTIEALLVGLDVERPQVFVECIIAEVALNKSEQLGFEWQLGGDIGNATVLARSNLASLGAAFVNPASLGGLILAAASQETIQLPDGTEIPAQAALFTALAADQDIEILSAPTLLTLDNQKAEILVGENVPFITGQGVDLSNVQNVFTTVERQDVGIKLTVTPQVAEGDVVVLDVQQEVSRVINKEILDANTVGPTTSKRSASTVVSVADGRTAVIGGLISNAVSARESKVPVLGDIPFIGRLFRADGVTDEKVNLIIFLTPHVVRSRADLANVSSQRQGKFEESMRSFNEMPADKYRRRLSESEPTERSDNPADLADPRKRFPDWPKIDDGEF
jgi:general secretion pathway protein D